MQIIPAIDIIDGKCVRLTQGDYSQKKIYNEHPLEVALRMEGAGLTRLHLVDLDGAREGGVRNWRVLETITGKTSLEIDFGGGDAWEKDVQIVFEAGGKWSTIGTIAVKNEEEVDRWIKKFGGDRFLIGADVRNEKLTIRGWTEQTEIDIYDFIERFMRKGIDQIFCTDVLKDGALEGPSLELYQNI